MKKRQGDLLGREIRDGSESAPAMAHTGVLLWGRWGEDGDSGVDQDGEEP